MDKKEKIIITFYTTSDALQMEEVCMQKQVCGRIIPVPKKISSSCGMAYCIDVSLENLILEIIAEAKLRIEGIHYEWI